MQSLLWINKNGRLMAKRFKVNFQVNFTDFCCLAKNNKLSLYDAGKTVALFYVAN